MIKHNHCTIHPEVDQGNGEIAFNLEVLEFLCGDCSEEFDKWLDNREPGKFFYRD